MINLFALIQMANRTPFSSDDADDIGNDDKGDGGEGGAGATFSWWWCKRLACVLAAAIVDAPVYVDAAEFNVTVFLNVFVV